jgi:hypothetical protein
MFGFMKKGLLKRMHSYAVRIQIACCEKLLADYEQTHDDSEAKTLAAAVCNRLFAKTKSPIHNQLLDGKIDELSADFLVGDDDYELKRGIVMVLRFFMLTEAEGGTSESLKRISETLHWIGEYITLPDEEPDPASLENLASALTREYVRR